MNSAIWREKNLFLIQQGQEAEHVLEMKKQEMAETKRKCEKEVNTLKVSELEIAERIERTNGDTNYLHKTTSDEQCKVIDS